MVLTWQSMRKRQASPQIRGAASNLEWFGPTTGRLPDARQDPDPTSMTPAARSRHQLTLSHTPFVICTRYTPHTRCIMGANEHGQMTRTSTQWSGLALHINDEARREVTWLREHDRMLECGIVVLKQHNVPSWHSLTAAPARRVLVSDEKRVPDLIGE